MPILDKEKRLEKKDVRQQERVAKKQMKDYDLGQQVRTEAGEYDIDIDKSDIGPLTTDRKTAIDKRITESTREDQREGLKKFQERISLPETKSQKPLDEQSLKDSLKKQKRAKWWDALYAFGEGLQGRTADPRAMRSKQLEAERKDLYEKYKSGAAGAKTAREDQEKQYIQQQIDYLKQLADQETDKLKKRKYESEIKKNEELAKKYTTEAKWKAGQPYYKPSSSTAKEDKPTYTYKTDDGQTLKMEVSQEDANRLNQLVLSANKMKAQRDALQDKMDSELYSAEGEGWFGKSKSAAQQEIKDKYTSQIESLDKLISNEQSSIESIFESNTSKSSPNSTEDDSIDPWDL